MLHISKLQTKDIKINGVYINMNEKEIETNQVDEFYTSVGFYLAEKESDLGLLASTDERKYYRFLVRTIPNVSNIDIITFK